MPDKRKAMYIVGHGQWEPDDGYAKVPPGCTISFYTEFGKTLHGNEADDIVAGRLNRKPTRTVEEFMMVPNMNYYPDSDENLQDFISLRNQHQPEAGLIYTKKGGGKNLEGLFAATEQQGQRNIDFHWTACLAVGFKNYTYDDSAHVGNVITGYNLTETTDGYYDFDYNEGVYKLIFKK